MGSKLAFSIATMSGSMIMINMRGASGQPCLMPERIFRYLSIAKGLVKRAVISSRRALTEFVNQVGIPISCRMLWM